jgi:acyl-CoA thioesterase YciA
MTADAASEPRGTLTIRTLAMPADTNPAGDIFGGWVLSQMDIAGSIHAVETVLGRVATVAVEAMTFIAPVKVGDVLCIYTRVERIGTTSITIAMEAWARRNRLADRVKVTEGRFIYVALDEHGNKRKIETGNSTD